MTPVTLFSLACTRAAQAAQVMPPMTSSTWVVWAGPVWASPAWAGPVVTPIVLPLDEASSIHD